MCRRVRGGFTGAVVIVVGVRCLPDAGRVFFDNPDALVPGDVSGTEDVYGWEADGVGVFDL